MQHKVFGILALLFSLFLFAIPASATTLTQCAVPDSPTTEFVLVGQNNIIFELQAKNSGRVINGNVLVTNPTVTKLGSPDGTGFIKVGANTNIQGTVIANTIIIADAGATLAHCIADVIVANTPAAKAACGTGFHAAPNTDFTAFVTAHPTCFDPLQFSTLCSSPAPAVNTCANSAPPLTVQAGDTVTLTTPDCFGALLLRNGAVLNLEGVGAYTFKSVKMEAGSRLNGPATVNVNGEFATDNGVFITDIDLRVAFATNAEVVKIFNNAVLTNTVINAPFGKCHLHTGDALTCSEACCKVLDVEPITAVCENDIVPCVCPPGFRFVDDVSRLCERIPPGE